MTLKVEGVVAVEQMLLNIDREGGRRLVNELYKHAIRTRDLARKFAPIDDGNLEQAIKVSPEQVGPLRDARGRFMRTEVEVYIDLDMPIEQRPGKTIGDYAYLQHEHLTPYGPWQLGERSRAKQAGQYERVGGGFLERAAEQLEAEFEGAMLDVLRDL